MRYSIWLYAQLRELGWRGANTTVVIVGDAGAEWIWNRATWFIRRCEILDFWHALKLMRGRSPACATATVRRRRTAGCIRSPRICAPVK